ncbi:ATP synthase subunit s, mitochondrial [Vespa crabro]|uniref:ATP synthase subunit s, mitochondrial n=1 Tax=Vespa crabro TaxID=7445 RepID=UPI001F02B793|nr:ATP synthase subunit s, mitochondrial [Vespa crabro]
MINQILNGKLSSFIRQENGLTKRSLFYWLTVIFNSVDKRRIEEVGPDQACAEWLLKNGAYVKWKNSSEYLTDYNVLIKQTGINYIQSVKAENSGITYVGFPYFDGCKHIEEVKLIRSRYICNRAMSLLSFLKESLTHLEVIECPSVTDEGLYKLKKLQKLKILKLEGMPYLKDPADVRKQLMESLPNTKIELK